MSLSTTETQRRLLLAERAHGVVQKEIQAVMVAIHNGDWVEAELRRLNATAAFESYLDLMIETGRKMQSS